MRSGAQVSRNWSTVSNGLLTTRWKTNNVDHCILVCFLVHPYERHGWAFWPSQRGTQTLDALLAPAFRLLIELGVATRARGHETWRGGQMGSNKHRDPA